MTRRPPTDCWSIFSRIGSLPWTIGRNWGAGGTDHHPVGGASVFYSLEMPTPAQLSVLCLIPSTLAMLWLVLRASWFWNHNPELQFGWVVLVLWAYLLCEAWSHRPAPRFQWTWRAALLTLFGLG